MRYLPAAVVVTWAAWALAEGQPNSSSVYPQQDSGLRFSHQRHQQVTCQECHPDKSQSDQSKAHERPGHQACRRCHPEANQNQGDAPGCVRCHATQPSGKQMPASSLRFSHALHSESEDGCVRCHNSENKGGPENLWPAFDRCASCHQALIDSGRCQACHWTLADGRLKLSVAGGELKPQGGHEGDRHDIGWKADHGRGARRQVGRCKTCHTQESCDRCHRGVARPFHLHPPDWTLSHPGEARAGLMDCQRCHRNQADCLGCHQNAGVAQSSPKRPKNMQLHPPGYASGQHAVDAKSNLRSCVSCHNEKDCIRCHGAAGKGLGASPHPPGFSGRCRLMRERNERPCLKCHLAADLEARCP